MRQSVHIGQRLTYDDGRPNHRKVKAAVVALTVSGFIAQFEDRADTTAINWDEAEWMRHIRFDN
jgi:hypothetical protein